MLHAPANESKVEAGRRRSEPVAPAEREHRPNAARAMDSAAALPGSAPDAYGNQAMLRTGARRTPLTASRPSRIGVLQRKCACGGGCPSCRGEAAIRPKLAINEPGDAFEQEADRTADQVMRMPDAREHASPAPPGVRRKCAECEEEEEKSTLQTKRDHSGAGTATAAAPPLVHEVLRSPGRPLDATTRALLRQTPDVK